MNEGGKKRYSPPAQEMSAEKKPKTSFSAREGLLVVNRFVIDLIYSKGKKNKAARSESVMRTMPKVASMIANRIA